MSKRQISTQIQGDENMNHYGYPEEQPKEPPKKTRDPWTFKDTVLLMSFIMIIALLGMLVWSGYDKQALETERNNYFKENTLLKRELRLSGEEPNQYSKQLETYKNTIKNNDQTIKECNQLLTQCKTQERNDLKAEQEFKTIQECEEKYEFMRTSLLNEYDIEADDFPKLINGLYYQGVIHVKVNENIEQGLRTLCHESTHYFIDEDYEHFCE
jgi:hypothetical protein